MSIDKSLTEQAKGGQLAKRRLTWQLKHRVNIAHLRDHTGAFNSWEKGATKKARARGAEGSVRRHTEIIEHAIRKRHWPFITNPHCTDTYEILTTFSPCDGNSQLSHCPYCRILHNHCFQFLQGITVVQREIENNGHAKFFGVNKVRYGLCKNSE